MLLGLCVFRAGCPKTVPFLTAPIYSPRSFASSHRMIAVIPSSPYHPVDFSLIFQSGISIDSFPCITTPPAALELSFTPVLVIQSLVSPFHVTEYYLSFLASSELSLLEDLTTHCSSLYLQSAADILTLSTTSKLPSSSDT